MNTNPKTLQHRQFTRPMTWASDEQLDLMRCELLEELRQLHESVRDLGMKRNGLLDVEREIKWRARTAHYGSEL